MKDVRPLPQVSVLMPVRDGARWIGESIESVLAQTFDDFELLIVDDGSHDATPAIVAGFSARDRRIVTIGQPASGLVAALNRGLAAARAPLLARLDADDIAEPTRLAEQVEAMARDPRLAVLGSWAFEIDENGRTCGARRPEADPGLLKLELARSNPMIHSAVMLRTPMAREAGGYRAAFAAAEDFDLWVRLSEQGSIANLKRELVRYRIHPDSVSARTALAQLLSARLVQRSAALRKAGQPDPVSDLQVALDLWGEPMQPYAADIAVFRLLAWASPQTIPEEQRSAIPDFGLLLRSDLTRRERRYAQRAILNYLAAHPEASRVARWAQLIGLRPLSSIPLIWRHLFQRSTESVRF